VQLSGTSGAWHLVTLFIVAPAKFPDKQLILSTWEPRVGRGAALSVWWTKLLLAQAIYVAGIDFVVVFLAIRLFHSQYAGALAWILGIAGMSYISTGFFGIWMFRHLASRSLGVRVTGRNTPPGANDLYLIWCSKNGVKPYVDQRN
jgi:hypothetical protein